MSDLFSLAGRHVCVTGASSGLGKHFAARLAEAGARVTLAARRKEALAASVDSIRAAGHTAAAVVMDVSKAESVARALDEAEAAFGPVNVLVNNAGVTETKPALEVTESGWDQVIGVNLKGVWLAAQQTAQRMVRHQTGGSIVNIASILGLRVAGGVAAYAVSKAGVIQMTKQLALEWARHNIRVNAIAPGYIATELNAEFFASPPGHALIKRIPQRRLGEARELDGALLLLASDAGSFMTGSVVVVDGGHLVSGL
ncbi:MAG TPA: SDR family NAD(P)-dependent oxidoreductase [Acetobacteraceae bacterium]|nr:SDR family NAD(P)-dependent oxidoreductase [Acetobacteraceae bacterium]